MLRIISSSVNQTEAIGQALGKVLTRSDMLLLNGELGAGKTAFVRGLVKGVGGSSCDVTSPSYTYLNIYEAPLKVFHLDVYLLHSFDDVFELGIEELYNKGLIVMEWGGKFSDDILDPHWNILVRYTDEENKRIIEINPPSDKTNLLKELTISGDFSI